MITKFARLEFKLFSKPSKSDFLRVHQILILEILNVFLWLIRGGSPSLTLNKLKRFETGSLVIKKKDQYSNDKWVLNQALTEKKKRGLIEKDPLCEVY